MKDAYKKIERWKEKECDLLSESEEEGDIHRNRESNETDRIMLSHLDLP